MVMKTTSAMTIAVAMLKKDPAVDDHDRHDDSVGKDDGAAVAADVDGVHGSGGRPDNVDDYGNQSNYI